MNSIRYNMPDKYNKDMLHLLVKDPNCLFIYWEISDRKKRMVMRHFSTDWKDIPKIIRLYVTENQIFNDSHPHAFDDFFTAETDSCYIHHLKPNTGYIVDYGIKNRNDQFIPLMRSNLVETPRNTPYSEKEEFNHSLPQNLQKSQIKPMDYDRFSAYSLYDIKESDLL